MERLYSAVCALKHTVTRQVDIGEKLSEVTTTIERRVAVVERHLAPCVEGPSSMGVSAPGIPNAIDVMSAVDIPEVAACMHSASTDCANADKAAFAMNGTIVESATVSDTQNCEYPPVSSPAWNLVVKQGRRARGENHPTALKRQAKPEHKRPAPIVGTGIQNTIKVVRTKLVTVFATRFLPDLDVTLTNYLKGHLRRDVQCQHIVTGNTRFSSFKIRVECENVT